MVVAFGSSANVWAKGKKPPADPKPAPAEQAPAEETATGSDSAEAPAEDTNPFANVKHEVGPKHIDLGDGLEIDLPAGYILLDPSVLGPDMIKNGDNLVGYKGSIFSASDTNWQIDIRWQDQGYISDSDAPDLDAKLMLQQYIDGTNQANETRKRNGIEPLFVDDWQTEPRYKRAEHHLVWGLNLHDSTGKIVNVITSVLGRRGVVELMLIGEPDKIAAQQAAALPAMNAIRFQPGSRYEDFDSSTDKSSGMGLKALVLGGVGVAVAKKTGLLVVLLLAMKKGAIVIFAPLILLFKKLFGRGGNANS
jgi:uncharacterized membrane-anchored protein